MKTIGIIGGMSWESTSVYYRLLNEGVRARLGGQHSAKVLLWSFDFAEVEALQVSGEWDRLSDLLADAALRLERACADFVLIATNTMHLCAEVVTQAVSIPLLHIADATGEAVTAQGCSRPLLLATRYTMEKEFYKGHLKGKYGLDVRIPDAAGRDEVHRIIFDELCQGQVLDASRAALLDLIAQAKAEGADSVILGCTEICLLLNASHTSLPMFDTTDVHAQAALEMALA